MTPDQKFSRYVRISLYGFILVFVYYLFADIYMPVTPQARIYHPVVQMAPQVSGRVTKVLVENNQAVKAGDVLFELDRQPYEIALEQAQLAVDDAHLQNQRLDTQIASINAQIKAAEAKLHEQKLLKARGQSLFQQGSISEQELETINANYSASVAALSSLNAQHAEVVLARGEQGQNNLALRHAVNQLAQAKLNLSYTQVRAETDGVIANLQLREGTFAVKGTPLLAVVASDADLVADFREKSLLHTHSGNEAVVVFDSHPGKVYPARIESYEAGVSAGQLNANGTLSVTETSNRWVRDAQRQRIHLTMTENVEMLKTMPSGARATVQLLPKTALGQWIARAQIKIISYLHYIY